MLESADQVADNGQANALACAPAQSRPSVSCLMATYARERPDRLARALESIFRQTTPPDEVVLAVDGPVPQEQEEVIQRYQHDARVKTMLVVRLRENQGLGPALNAGLAECRGEWIMRMDSDDESMEDRLAVQLEYLQRNPGIDVVGGWSQEFFEESSVTRLKSSPVSHDAITMSLRFRNVLVHPSLLVRATALRAVQGYRAEFPLLEDWDLYIRMQLADSRFAVIPKVLVRMLVGRDMAARRGGFRYLRNETRFRTFLWSRGVISTGQLGFSLVAYAIFRMAGSAIRTRLYNTVRIVE